MQDAQHYAKVILAEIHHDMLVPFSWGGTIPWDVGSFSALHDHCDANGYLLDNIPHENAPECICDPDAPGWIGGVDPRCEYHDSWDEYTAFADEVSGIVARALADEARALHTCLACGMDLYPNGPFDGTLPSSGIDHGHEGFGETFMCLDGHWFTLILGAMVPPERILTVVE